MASSGGGTAAVWLGGADASDLLSLFRYLGFDAGGVDPAQLLAAADWAADARHHRLVRALGSSTGGSCDSPGSLQTLLLFDVPLAPRRRRQ